MITSSKCRPRKSAGLFRVTIHRTKLPQPRLQQNQDEAWWEGETTFFDVRRSRAWVMTRRMTHTAHHRGQQLALLRMLGREEYSNYGPTADTGGLMQNHAPTIYAYPNLQALLEGEAAGGRKTQLPHPGAKPVTERPG